MRTFADNVAGGGGGTACLLFAWLMGSWGAREYFLYSFAVLGYLEDPKTSILSVWVWYCRSTLARKLPIYHCRLWKSSAFVTQIRVAVEQITQRGNSLRYSVVVDSRL